MLLLNSLTHVGRRPRFAVRRLAPALALGLAPLLNPMQAAVVRADGTCTTTGGVVACTYASTGAEQTFTVPTGVTSINVTAVGAAGGSGDSTGGRGAQVTGVVGDLTPGQILYVEVGGAPTTNTGCYMSRTCVGGFNGGGSSHTGRGGGGASDLRTASRTAPTSLDSRLLVAGGGGGASAGGGDCGSVYRAAPSSAAGGDAGAAGAGDYGGRCQAASSGGGAGSRTASGGAGSPNGAAGSLGQGGSGGKAGNGAGGGGGGGLFGGGGGGDILCAPIDFCATVTSGGGGGGGSSLVPSGGTLALSSAPPSVTITYTGPLPATPAAAAGMTAPLFRLSNPVQRDHLYTTSTAERDQAVASEGYVSEGTAADVSTTTQTGLVPLYRVSRTSGSTWDRLYTTSAAERDQAVASDGYSSEGIAAYVSATAGTGLVPLYRLNNAGAGTHLYTTSTTERDSAIANLGFSSEGIAAYVAPAS